MFSPFTRSAIIVATVVTVISLGGCTSLAPPPASLPSSSPPLRSLNELNAVKEELQHLRNLVEELQFAVESDDLRQQNLFQDIDRRLFNLESEDGDANTDTEKNTVVAEENLSKPKQESVSPQQQLQYDQAFALLKQSKYPEAISAFQELVTADPRGPLADDANYWIAEARYVNREFETALSGFQNLIDDYPQSARVPESLLKMGYIKYDVGSYEEAAEIFRAVLEKYPTHQVAGAAQVRLRRIEQIIQ